MSGVRRRYLSHPNPEPYVSCTFEPEPQNKGGQQSARKIAKETLELIPHGGSEGQGRLECLIRLIEDQQQLTLEKRPVWVPL
jgi:hypothetical protein